MPELPELRVAVGVLQNPAGEVLIAQRPQAVSRPGAWEFPGGKIEARETALQGLERELQEELAIRIRYVRYLADLRHDYGDAEGLSRVRLYCWKILVWDGKAHAAESQVLEWVKPDQLYAKGLLDADRPLVELLQEPAALNDLSWEPLVASLNF